LKPSELYQFAACCLSLDDYPERKSGIAEQINSGQVTVDQLVYLCSNYLVLPSLYIKFSIHGLLHLFSKELRDHLEELYLLNKKRNEQILEQVIEINEIFAGKNVVPVYLKGTANLMDGLYCDPGERMIGDIDVLVKDTDFLKAAELVQQLGYENQSTMYDDVTRKKDFPRLFRKDVPADVEIHRLPVEIPYSHKFGTDMLFRDKQPVSKMENCFIPSAEHRLIHNFIHSQLSNSGYLFKQTTLRDLFDFYLLSKQTNFTKVLSNTQKKELLEIYFFVSQKLFNNEKTDLELSGKVKRFYSLHNYFLNHRKLHRGFIRLIQLLRLIFIRYFGKLLSAFYSKQSRNYIVNRLSDAKWYKKHISGLKKQFK